MALGARRMTYQGQSFRDRWLPNVRGYNWSPTRVAGLVPVLLVLCIIGVAYVVAVPITLIPMLRSHFFLACVLLVVFHFIYINVLANYALLVYADPGRVPGSWKAPPPVPGSIAVEAASFPTGTRHSDKVAVGEGNMEDDFEDVAIPRVPLIQRRGEYTPVHLHAEGEAQLPQPEPFRQFHLMQERSFDGEYRYCRKCNHYKPDRSHHCSVCGVCILRFDHHCVFINSCVGFWNQKFFVSFVLYAFLGCAFVCIVAFREFFAAIGETPHRMTSAGNAATSKLSGVHSTSTALAAVLVVGYILTSAFCFALGIFVMFHAYLVCKGRTTVEMYDIVDPIRAARVAQYDLGIRENVRLVFGNVKKYWILPTRYGLDGDGLSYRRSQPCNASDTLPDGQAECA